MADFSFSTIPSNECIGNSLSTINLNFNSATEDLSGLNTKINAVSAHSLNTVQKIVAGSNILISPENGTGIVTISSIAVNGETPTGQEILSATNVGPLGVGVFRRKVGQGLEFKKLVSGGTNVRLQEIGEDMIRIIAFDRSGSPGGETNIAINKGDGLSLVLPKENIALPFKSLKGNTDGISLSSGLETILISNNLSARNLGSGFQLFKTKEGNNLTFKTLVTGSKGIKIEDGSDGNTIKFSIIPSVTADNLGVGAEIFKNLSYINNDQSSPCLNFKTLISGANTPGISDSQCSVKFAPTANSIELTVFDNVSGTNVGNGPGKIYKQKSGNLLQLRTIKAASGSGISIAANQNSDEITISAEAKVLSAVVVGTNAGSSGLGIYKEKNGHELVFRRLVAGNGVQLSDDVDSITINSVVQGTGGGDVTGGLNLGGGVGIFDSKTGTNLQFKTLSSASPTLRINENLSTKVVTLSVHNVITTAQNNPSEGIGVYKEKVEGSLIFKTIKAGAGISVQDGQGDNGQIVISTANSNNNSANQQSTGFKNKIINGNFDIWQRNNSNNSIVDTNNATQVKFLADRFGFFAGNRLTGGSGNSTATLSCVGLTLTDTLAISSRPTYCQRIILGERPVSNATPTTFLQRIENVISLAGKQFTLTFWARSNNTGNSTLPVFYQQIYKVVPTTSFGPGGNVAVGAANLTSNWAKHTITFTINPIDLNAWNAVWPNSIVDSKWNSYTQISFQIPGSAGRYVDITGIQLEEGGTSTEFEQRPEIVEFNLCQRYYQKEDEKYHVFPAGPWSEASHTIRIPPMRTAPTVTHTILESQRLGIAGTPAFWGLKSDQLQFLYDHDAQTTSAGWVRYSWTASAEF